MTLLPVDIVKKPVILLAQKGPTANPLDQALKTLADKKAGPGKREAAAGQMSVLLDISLPRKKDLNRIIQSLLPLLGEDSDTIRVYCADAIGTVSASMPMNLQASLLDDLLKLRKKNDRFKEGVDMALGAMHGSNIGPAIKARIEAFWASLEK